MICVVVSVGVLQTIIAQCRYAGGFVRSWMFELYPFCTKSDGDWFSLSGRSCASKIMERACRKLHIDLPDLLVRRL